MTQTNWFSDLNLTCLTRTLVTNQVTAGANHTTPDIDFTMLKRKPKTSEVREVILIKPPEADWPPGERKDLARKRHNAGKHFRTNHPYLPPRSRE